jgi:hypothetical protein
MTEKRQTSQGYIIRILQHFATKHWNITNFVVLFQAVMKFLSTQVVNSQILPKPNKFHVTSFALRIVARNCPVGLKCLSAFDMQQGFLFFS